MDSFWVTVFALGIAGLDPVGALLGIGALTSGSRRVTVILYGVTILLVTVTVGTLLSLTSATLSINIDWSFPMIPDSVWAVGQAGVGLALLILGINRLRSKPKRDNATPKRRLGNPWILIGTGLLFGISAPTDPSFLALTYLVGRTENLVAILAAHSAWIVISQLPLVIFITAVALNKHHVVISPIQRAWDRIKPIFSHSLTALVSAAGALLIVETGWWLTSGHWFPYWS